MSDPDLYGPFEFRSLKIYQAFQNADKQRTTVNQKLDGNESELEASGGRKHLQSGNRGPKEAQPPHV
ncbi:hypothetical protein GCK32_005818 [Trichostrongylus colubriformis]|uniref:Uncharacterized protein n=1 Tax=Trichostrongylus colubriformis TaxID=6319 RepID=A0AAN8ITS0_TRICO